MLKNAVRELDLINSLTNSIVLFTPALFASLTSLTSLSKLFMMFAS